MKTANKFDMINPPMTRAILEALPEPSLVLDADLRILAASTSFYDTFDKFKDQTQGQLVYYIGVHQYNIPALRNFLAHIIPDDSVLREYKVVYDSLTGGRRTVLVGARRTTYENSVHKYIFVTIDDISAEESVLPTV
jgi:PAS domain-containing protein